MARILLLVWMFFLVGCGPRYLIKNQYIPPATAASQPCIENCSHMREGCQNQCQQNYQYCLNDAYMKAQSVDIDEQRTYDIAYSHYMLDMSRYRMALHEWQRDYYDYSRDFEHFQKQCEREKDAYACKKRDDLKHYLNRLNRDRPREPWMPTRRSFEQILVAQQSFCTTNCGCEQVYDNCFVGCGGQVIPHKICVDNCE